jgi:nitrogen fixation protein FixH
MVMRLAEDDETSRLLWERMPPLIGITPVAGLKKGATPLLTQKREDGGRVVLAVQNYGQGRAAAFTSGGSWYWQVSRPASDEFHEKFWKQMIRWLVVGAKERLTVETDADVYARKDSVIVRATVRQKDLRPVNDATVLAAVTDPLGNTEEIPMYWTLSEAGVYQCRYKPNEEGNYRVAVRVEGWQLKPVETPFEVAEPLVEFSNAGRKDAVLQDMARIAGGRYLPIEEASAIPQEIAKAVRNVRETKNTPVDRELWDMPALFLLCLALLSIEWLVRRKSGLA